MVVAYAILMLPLAAHAFEPYYYDRDDTETRMSGDYTHVYFVDEDITGQDYLEAGDAERLADGTIRASGGARLVINSLIEDGTIVITAEDAEFNIEDGTALAWGNVMVELTELGLTVECDYLSYEPYMGKLEVAGVKVALPMAVDLGLDDQGRDEPRARLGGHLYGRVPDKVFMASGELAVDMGHGGQHMVLRDVRLTHHPDPDPDLFIHVDEIHFADNDQITFRGFSVKLSGIEVFSWPQFDRSLKKRERVINFGWPQISYSSDVGVSWKQPVNFDFDMANAETTLDYSPEYGLMVSGYGYVEPWDGGEFGLEWGRKRTVDIKRVALRRHDSYNMVLRQNFSDGGWFRHMRLTAEYGKIATRTDPPRDNPTIPVIITDDTRKFAGARIDFPLLEVTKNLYVTTGVEGRYAHYVDHDQNYSVTGGYGGLIWQDGGFDHFVMYRGNRINGESVFSFDQVREREIDFATSLRLHPDWRHVIRGIYDLEEGEYNMLQVGAMKRQKAYEIGVYWDFARENGGLEFGLLFD